MDKPTVVDEFYNNFTNLSVFLLKQNEPSFNSLIEENFKKSLILCAASYFEHLITKIILDYFRFVTSEDDKSFSFVKNKAIARQFHTFFTWESTNANSFLGLFGDEFKTNFIKRVKAEPKLESSIKSFIELGGERNRLAHQNFGMYSIEKTVKEIHTLYSDAVYFIEVFALELFPKPDK